MIFEETTIVNAGPFLGEHTVRWPLGPVVVVAEYDGAQDRSNRAGKSWLASDAPRFALFGALRHSLDRFPHVAVLGRQDAYVRQVVVNSLGCRFELVRGRSAGGNPIRSLNGSELSDADLQEAVLQEILGLDEVEYNLTAAAPQRRLHTFMEMTAEVKRKTLSPWFRTDRWIPRGRLASTRLLAARRRLTSLEVRVDELTRTIGEVNLEVLRDLWFSATIWVQAAEEAQAATALDLARLEEVVGSRQERLGRLAELDVEIEDLTRGVGETERELQLSRALGGKLSGELKVARAVARARDEEVRELGDAGVDLDLACSEHRACVARFSGAEEEVTKLEERSRGVRLALQKMMEERTGMCPILGETCGRIEFSEEVAKDMRREERSLGREVNLLRKKVTKLRGEVTSSRDRMSAAQAALVRLRRLEREESLEALENRATAAQAAQAASLRHLEERLRDQRAHLGREATARAAALSELGPEGAHAAAMRAARAAFLEAQVNLDASLAARAQAAQRVEGHVLGVKALGNLRADLEVAKQEVGDLAWVNYTFGSAGIPGREIQNAFGAAEVEMNRVLVDMRTHLRLRFSATRELKEWEAACLACGEVFPKGTRSQVCQVCGNPRAKRQRSELRLQVEDASEVTEWSEDSGGGQTLLSLGVRMGLLRLASRGRPVTCEHILLDEVDGALDAPNRAALYALLHSKLPLLGLKQVILVTHTEAREEFAAAVVVRRYQGENRSEVLS